MSFQQFKRLINGDSPGRITELCYYKIGPEHNGDVPKVYLQAALHADEQPGIMVLHHLLALLKAADERGELSAQFVVMPMVNPLGMGGLAFNQHQGRYDAVSGVNFNRKWPRLYPVISDEIGGKLSQDAEKNQQLILEAVAKWLGAASPVSALDQQRHFVIQEAYDADYVLDLHCDNDALVHLFAVPQLKESAHQLGTWIGSAATLLAEDSGGGSFDEIWPVLWIEAARANPEYPIPQKVKASGTVEYRGQADTFDALNHKDATQLYGFFQEEGLIGGELICAKPDESPEPTDLDATEMLRVNQAGLLAYCVELGDVVEKGQVIADLIALEGEHAFQQRTPVCANTSGRIISRNINKYVWPGCSIAKIVGTEKLQSRGDYLLED
jgi:predicted deacylase